VSKITLYTPYLPALRVTISAGLALSLCAVTICDDNLPQAPTPVVSAIATYGFRTVVPGEAIEAVGIHVGDDLTNIDIDHARRRLKTLPNVREAQIAPVYGKILDGGKTGLVLYIGIVESGIGTVKYRQSPNGTAELPTDVKEAYLRAERAFANAAAEGHFGEDRSHGHSLSENPRLRDAQLAYIQLANLHWDRLLDVLHNSDSSTQRAIAAQVLAYANDKEEVARQLMQAANDPSPHVRNNAIRAVSVLFDMADPELDVIPTESFVDYLVALLDSVEWTDRNKAVALLLKMDDRQLVTTQLRKRALPSLEEMCDWPSGHGMMAFMLVGKMAGMTHEASQAAWRRSDKEKVISAARATSGGG
jgi:hypothetical protein